MSDRISDTDLARIVSGDTDWIVEAARLAAQHVHTGTTFTLGDGTWESPTMMWDEDYIFFKFIEYHAFGLLFYARMFGFGAGVEDTFTAALRWLAEFRDKYGFVGVNAPHTSGPDEPEYETLPPVYVESWDLGGWPPAAHLRLHYLAEMGWGWVCRDCGVDLIDICKDDDIAVDQAGRRMVRPGCSKRLPTKDHMVPQSMNGSHGPQNLALVCQPCNSRKGAS